jgi:hypothetical protein
MLQDLTTNSRLFEAAFTLSTQPELRDKIGRLEPVGADFLGVQRTTLLVVRPDCHIGLRSDGDHLNVIANSSILSVLKGCQRPIGKPCLSSLERDIGTVATVDPWQTVCCFCISTPQAPSF